MKNNRALGKSVEAQRINLAVDKIRVEVNRRYQELMQSDGYVAAAKLKYACLDIGVKQETEVRFDFYIDCVPHVSWFRRKKDEFMETLGIPARKQNRDIKLQIIIKSMIVEYYITDFLYFYTRIGATISTI